MSIRYRSNGKQLGSALAEHNRLAVAVANTQEVAVVGADDNITDGCGKRHCQRCQQQGVGPSISSPVHPLRSSAFPLPAFPLRPQSPFRAVVMQLAGMMQLARSS